jgi:hypothetical protein
VSLAARELALARREHRARDPELRRARDALSRAASARIAIILAGSNVLSSGFRGCVRALRNRPALIRYISATVYDVRVTLVRTQISVTSVQHDALRRIASRRGVSMAVVVREAIDRVVDREDAAARRHRALAVVGTGRSGRPDIAENHDEHLAHAYLDWQSS